ncbi:MAG: hypothetical protein RQ875_00700 [Vicingaceae bacterium]|nr:hypothetical protein [Vicingaceae bacterium]
MKKIKILLLLMLLIGHVVAQDTIKTSVIVFDHDDVDEVIKSGGKKSLRKKNALKINPLLILNGEIPVFYERAISDRFSVEFAIGLTFVDYMGNNTNAFFSSNEDDERINAGNNVTEKINKNVSFKSGLRYYLDDLILEDYYFAIEFASRTFSRELIIDEDQFGPTGYNLGYSVKKEFDEIQIHKEMKLIIGNQTHSYSGNFFIDYYIGVGIDMFIKEEARENYSASNGNIRSYVLKKEDGVKPRFYFGFKMGFLF